MPAMGAVVVGLMSTASTMVIVHVMAATVMVATIIAATVIAGDVIASASLANVTRCVVSAATCHLDVIQLHDAGMVATVIPSSALAVPIVLLPVVCTFLRQKVISLAGRCCDADAIDIAVEGGLCRHGEKRRTERCRPADHDLSQSHRFSPRWPRSVEPGRGTSPTFDTPRLRRLRWMRNVPQTNTSGSRTLVPKGPVTAGPVADSGADDCAWAQTAGGQSGHLTKQLQQRDTDRRLRRVTVRVRKGLLQAVCPT